MSSETVHTVLLWRINNSEQ